jgi:hypothetical protein
MGACRASRDHGRGQRAQNSRPHRGSQPAGVTKTSIGLLTSPCPPLPATTADAIDASIGGRQGRLDGSKVVK